MDWPTRFGVVGGYMIALTVLYLLYDHRPAGPGVVPWWMVPVAALVGWIGMETSSRLRRARSLAGLFGLVGLLFTGVWWWWPQALDKQLNPGAHPLDWMNPSVPPLI